MTTNFRSDNETPIATAILEAIIEANHGTAWAYAEDDWSERLDQAFSDLFRTDAIVLPVSTGTVANSIALAIVTRPWGSVFCHTGAHIQNDEGGAPEFFGNGLRSRRTNTQCGSVNSTMLFATIMDCEGMCAGLLNGRLDPFRRL